MKIHRFFIDQILPESGKVKIENIDLIHQWQHVLRFRSGEEVILFNNTGSEFKAKIISIGKKDAEVEISSSQKVDTTSKLSLFIFLALPKRDSFEWIIEKGTELGVAGFVPVISERSEKKEINIERTKKIAREAAEQSGSVALPEIFEPVPLSVSLENVTGTSVVFDPRGGVFDYRKSIIENPPARINVFIGPEGGFSESEIDLFKSKNMPVYSLGKQILRVETATIAISSILLLDF